MTTTMMTVLVVRFFFMSVFGPSSKNVLRSFLFRRHRDHCRACHLDPQVVGRNAQLHYILFYRQDGAADAAGGNDLVPCLELAQHLLPFLLAPLLRHDE